MSSLARTLTVSPAFRFPVASHGLRFFKYLLFVLFLVNVRSWPFAWHVRVFRPVVSLRLRFYLLRLSLISRPRRVRQQIKGQWFRELSPVGLNPLDLVKTWRNWASPDDCDFNLHLSNSCYAKSLDCARFQHALRSFPTLFRAGGWMALGGTHYNFLREIPIFSRYEVRVSIASWDNKWIYIVARYVSHPSTKAKSKAKFHRPPSSAVSSVDVKVPPTPPEENAAATASAVPYPVLRTPAAPDTPEASATTSRRDSPPTPSSPTFPNAASLHNAESFPAGGQAHALSAALKKQTQAQAKRSEPDGTTLHCVAVSALCFKTGRITIPPALALACEGFCAPPYDLEAPSSKGRDEAEKGKAPSQTYSLAHPPPFWHHVQRLRGTDLDLRALRAFFAGGWREVPESERWWEAALQGDVERRRAAGMEVVGALRRGMEGVQGL